MSFIQDNKDLIKEYGYEKFFIVWAKLLIYLLFMPLMTILFLIKGIWLLAALFLILTLLTYGLAFGGQRFVVFLADKLIKFRNLFTKKKK